MPSKFPFFVSLLLGLPTYGACPPAGSGIVVNGTTATESGCTITTSTTTTPGTNANAGGKITLSDSTITTTAAGSYAAYSNGAGSLITLNNVTATTSTSNVLFSNSGDIEFNTGSITALGASTNGAQVLGAGAILNISHAMVQANGSSGIGVFAQTGGHSVNITDCTITTIGTGGRAIDSSGTGTSVRVTDSTIKTLGSNSIGAISARTGSDIDIFNTDITSQVYGVHTSGLSGSVINATNSSINILGNTVFGAYAQDASTISLTNTPVTTVGTTSHGFFIQDGSTGIMRNEQIQTSGDNSQGIFMIGFSAGNQATLSNSTIKTSGINANAALFFANAGLTNTMQATDTTFSASHANLFEGAGGIANVTFQDVTAHAASDFLLLLVDGSNPATVNLSARNSHLSGDIEVIAGNTGNITLTNGTNWTGAALDVTNMNINGSQWNLTANSNITNQLTNAGYIDFVSQGNNFKTLTVAGDYVGQNGTIALNTLLEGDGSPSDLLIVDGAPASGHTFLDIKNTTGEGQETVGNGIMVVEAINGGTTDPNSFSLGNEVIAGPYEYLLYRGGFNGTDPDNWFLRSSFGPGPDPVPDYRPEVSLYSALPSLALLYGRTLLDTLHQRVGEEALLLCNDDYCCPSSPYMNGLWVRAINSGGYQHNGGIYRRGADFDYQLFGVQAGVDLYRDRHFDGSCDFFGVLGAIGTGHSHVKHLGHHAGKNEFTAYSGGAYLTHFGPSGWYIDGVFEANWYSRVRSHSDYIPELRTHGIGYTGSLEAGYPFDLCYFILEPQIQLMYQKLTFNNTEDIGAEIDFRRTHSTAGRLGLRLADTWIVGALCSGEPRYFSLWLRGSVWHDFQGNSKTLFSSDDGFIAFGSDLQGTWFQGDLGWTLSLTDVYSFYGSVGGNVYLDRNGQCYNAIAGLRANF